MIFWLVLKLEISCRVLKGFWFLIEDFFFNILYFCMVKYVSFHNSFFCLKIHFNVNGKAHSVKHPLVLMCVTTITKFVK
jgi:hypothetical protein